MKIIFLDIDGVLNYYKSEILDKNCVKNLKQIVSKTNAKIVLISTWKYFLDDKYLNHSTSSKNKEDYLKYREIFHSVFKENLSLLGIVEDINGDRCYEISKWLKYNESLGVENFVIIDDFDCGYSIYYNDNYVQTSMYNFGLTENKMKKAIHILNK